MLLGLLLLRRGEIVTTTTLIDEIWDERPPPSADHSIQAYVSGLRGVLGADRIVTAGSGYRIWLEDAWLDLTELESAAATAQDLAARGQSEAAYEVLSGVLELTRAEPLADIELGVRSSSLRTTVTERQLQALETWAEMAIASGHPERTISELEEAVTRHPLREPMWGLLMRALDSSGRPAEALRAYGQLRRILAEEMGIDPSSELRQLEESLLLADTAPALPARNPYKGLRAFAEEDSSDFFGRDSLLRELIEAVLDRNRPMVSVVGPSGSGKSSVVRAGLIPALKQGAVTGSENWRYVVLQPGRHPLTSLRSVLGLGPSDDPFAALAETTDRMLLVIDQLEEVFTATGEETGRSYLDLLSDLTGVDQIRLVATLRADFYDRPLLHSRFGRTFAAGVVHVHPLSPEELEVAAAAPAAQVGVRLQPALISQLISDVTARPGSLPLFQYALTESFEHRHGDLLTVDGYRAIGGISGALVRRAEETFEDLTTDEREASRQVFYRLVAVGEGVQVTRRRVAMAELRALAISGEHLREVLDRFGHPRLLSFDRDPVLGEATVEVAHEALLAEWPRLSGWVDTARGDLRRRASLAAARDEWIEAGEDAGFLLSGTRLEQYEEWAGKTLVTLTTDERDFLDRSRSARDDALAEQRELAAAERRRRRRRRTLRWSSAAAAAMVVVAAVALTSASQPRIVTFVEGGGDLGVNDLVLAGLSRAETRHRLSIERIVPLIDPHAVLAERCRAGVDLVITFGSLVAAELDPSDPECAGVMFAMIDLSPRKVAYELDYELEYPNLSISTFRQDHGSFLAGALAARTSTTGTIGFVGGVREIVEEFLSGFVAGARTIDPTIDVAVVWTETFNNPPAGRAAAERLIAEGADVIYHASGFTGRGVLDAVTDANQAGSAVWYIGVDVDEALTAPPQSRPYVLASMLKRIDVAVVEAVDAFLQGSLRAGPIDFDLTNGGIELRTRPGHPGLDPAEVENWGRFLDTGEIRIPEPARDVKLYSLGTGQVRSASLEFANGSCHYLGPTEVVEGDSIIVSIATGEGGFIKLAEPYPFSRNPIHLDEPPAPHFAPNTGVIDRNSVTLPASIGTWWVACIDGDFVYPAAEIAITPRE